VELEEKWKFRLLSLETLSKQKKALKLNLNWVIVRMVAKVLIV